MRRRDASRRLPAVIAVLGLGFFLAGCISIPTSGPVEVAGRIADVEPEPAVRFYPNPPQPGADPAQIVRGFLRAQVDTNSDHEVARSFLTPARRSTWRAENSVSVHEADSATIPITLAQPVTETSDTATVTLQLPMAAQITDQGQYRSRNESTTVTFGLIKTDGQWRIATLNDGIILSHTEFLATFRPAQLYFVDSSGSFLVPDTRWFAVGSTAASQLVAALLDGPASWLADAVQTNAPAGTQLTTTGVLVDDDQAEVDLTRQALDAQPRARQLLVAQLAATLQGSEGFFQRRLQRIEVTVEGAQLEYPTSEPLPVRADNLSALSTPVVLDESNHLAWLQKSTTTPVPDVEPVSGRDVSRPAANDDGTLFAVLTNGRRTLVTLEPKNPMHPRFSGTQLTAPSIDRFGWVWSADVTGRVTAAGRSVVNVPAGWLRAYQAQSLRISRHGAMALIVTMRNGAARIFVAGVVRDGSGWPQRLTNPTELELNLSQAFDASWINERTVAVLGIGGGDPQRRVWQALVGGESAVSVTVPGAVSLTTAGDIYNMWVNANGVAAYRVGANFFPVPTARWPAAPG